MHESTKHLIGGLRHAITPPTADDPPSNVALPPSAMAEYVETISAPEASMTAKGIVEAAALAKAGGPPMPKLSDTAQAILRAGERRRGG